MDTSKNAKLNQLRTVSTVSKTKSFRSHLISFLTMFLKKSNTSRNIIIDNSFTTPSKTTLLSSIILWTAYNLITCRLKIHPLLLIISNCMKINKNSAPPFSTNTSKINHSSIRSPLHPHNLAKLAPCFPSFTMLFHIKHMGFPLRMYLFSRLILRGNGFCRLRNGSHHPWVPIYFTGIISKNLLLLCNIKRIYCLF